MAWNFRQLSCALGDSVRLNMLEGFASALKDFEHPSSGSEFRSGKWCFLVILTPSLTDRTQKLLPNNYSIILATATSISTTQFHLCKLSKRGNSQAKSHSTFVRFSSNSRYRSSTIPETAIFPKLCESLSIFH